MSEYFTVIYYNGYKRQLPYNKSNKKYIKKIIRALKRKKGKLYRELLECELVKATYKGEVLFEITWE